MTAHKYADLFKAKLDNIDLVLFEKHYEWEEWQECKTDTRKDAKIFFVSDNFEYFLCLPQHKEACLHWLNGGDSEYEYENKWFSIVDEEWTKQWSMKSGFMYDSNTFRIKPRKEKRWIIYRNGDASSNVYHSEPKCPKGAQLIEIEVEV